MKMRRNTFAIVLITVYMKKKIISFSTALMMVFGLAENATAEELVVVNDAQGGKSVFKLSTRPTISFDNYNIVLTTDETTVIDPRTEYPVQQDILSSTVVAPDCMTADAFATAFMVLGSKVLANNESIKAYFIIADESEPSGYKVLYSDSLKQMIASNQ